MIRMKKPKMDTESMNEEIRTLIELMEASIKLLREIDQKLTEAKSLAVGDRVKFIWVKKVEEGTSIERIEASKHSAEKVRNTSEIDHIETRPVRPQPFSFRIGNVE